MVKILKYPVMVLFVITVTAILMGNFTFPRQRTVYLALIQFHYENYFVSLTNESWIQNNFYFLFLLYFACFYGV